jgi:hypothetical protein
MPLFNIMLKTHPRAAPLEVLRVVQELEIPVAIWGFRTPLQGS